MHRRRRVCMHDGHCVANHHCRHTVCKRHRISTCRKFWQVSRPMGALRKRIGTCKVRELFISAMKTSVLTLSTQSGVSTE